MVHLNCPELDSSWDSYAISLKETKGEKKVIGGGAGSCKWDNVPPVGMQPAPCVSH